ncbi:MAG: hypothetical protein JXB88_16590 [Spirochaetales bacterium]|nr:hypothetical protein [Spirochaetales bacterium]
MNNQSEYEAVISGIGIVSPLGSDKQMVWENICRKKTGIRKAVHDDLCFNSGVPFISPVDYMHEFKKLNNRKNKRFMRRNVLFFLEALNLAIEDAKIGKQVADNHQDIAIITTCGDAGTDFRLFLPSVLRSIDEKSGTREVNMKIFGSRGLALLDPYFLIYDLLNSANCFAAIEHGINGDSNNFIMSGGAGFHSVKAGWEVIKSGKTKIAITGVTESLLNSAEMQYLYRRFGYPGKAVNGDNAIIPYSDEKEGLFFGEGAVVLILEEYNHAKNRGAHVYGKIHSYATCVDLNPELFSGDAGGEGVMRCLKKCLDMHEDDKKNVTPSLVITAGMALKNEDDGELHALKHLFHDTPGIHYATFKPNFGYIGPVSDVLEFVIGLLAMKKEQVPPVKNLGNKARGMNFNVSDKEYTASINDVLSLAKGLGGINSALFVRKI